MRLGNCFRPAKKKKKKEDDDGLDPESQAAEAIADAADAAAEAAAAAAAESAEDKAEGDEPSKDKAPPAYEENNDLFKIEKRPKVKSSTPRKPKPNK